MKSLGDALREITLYDLLGYLLPGMVFLAGVVVGGWAIVEPRAHLRVGGLSGLAIALLTLAAYISGHVAQALGNIVEKRVRFVQLELAPELEAASTLAISRLLAIPTQVGENDNSSSLRSLLRPVALLSRDHPYVEIFQYREGFYRGMMVAWSGVFIGALLRAVSGTDAAFALGRDELYVVSDSVLYSAAVVAIPLVLLFAARFGKFARLRLEFAAVAVIRAEASTPAQR